jgi:hypothetical protein
MCPENRSSTYVLQCLEVEPNANATGVCEPEKTMLSHNLRFAAVLTFYNVVRVRARQADV